MTLEQHRLELWPATYMRIILWRLMQRVDSLEKTLMLGKTEGRRG